MNKETTKELQLLIEFTESMEKSIETMQKVTSEQCDLKNLVVLHDEEHRLDEFSSIINAYGWEESSIIDNYYSKEIEFNGEKQLIKR